MLAAVQYDLDAVSLSLHPKPIEVGAIPIYMPQDLPISLFELLLGEWLFTPSTFHPVTDF